MILKKLIAMKKICSVFGMILFSAVAFSQQAAQYSQYMFNGLYINPAYAGYRESLNLHTYFRSQWTGMPDGPQTLAFAVDGITRNDNVGLGLNIMNDRIGLERRLSAYANYAYRLRVSSDPGTRLSFGLGLGLVNASFDNGRAVTTNPEAIALENTLLPDARVGVFYATDLFFAGIGADNLISNLVFNGNNNTTKIPPITHYYLTAGGLVPLSSDVLLKPSFLLKDAERDDSRAMTLDLNAAAIFAEAYSRESSSRSIAWN